MPKTPPKPRTRSSPRWCGGAATLEAEAEELKLKKGEMPEAEWNAQFEKLMLDLAMVSAEIRKKS